METKNQKEEGKVPMRSKILAFSGSVAIMALMRLEEKEISCQYIGIDTSEKLVIKIKYRQDQESYVEKLIEEMTDNDKCVSVLTAAFDEILKIKFKE